MLSTVLIAGVVALKFGLPLLLVPFPFAAGWANFVLDTVDGDILVPLGLHEPTYQLVDKAADWVTYVLMVVAAWRWRIWRVVLALFVLRSVGQALFFLTGDELMFFFFPNFLEPLFLVYATIRFFKQDRAHEFFQRHVVALTLLIVVYKMQDEWITHVANVDRSELISRLLPPW